MVKISVTGNIISKLSKNRVLFKVGETPKITCSGENARDLVLSTVDELGILREQPTHVENKTTIGFVVNKTETPTQIKFACDSHLNELRDTTVVVFDGSPDLRNFDCMSRNFIELNCTWTTSNVIASFNLYARTNDNRSLKICDISEDTTKSSVYCLWSRYSSPRYNPDEPTLHFLMAYCNYSTCLNKTYEFDHLSIVKLDPPKLTLGTVYNRDCARRVEVRAWIPVDTFRLLKGIGYKIELWSLPDRPEDSVQHSMTISGHRFSTRLDLPCFAETYEIRVFVHAYQAVDEKYTSDSASVRVKVDKFNLQHCPQCLDREPHVSPATMLQKIYMFRNHFTEYQSLVKMDIEKLKESLERSLEIKENIIRRDN